MSYYLYILFSTKLNKYYIGSTEDTERRLLRHNAGHSKFTKTGVPWILVYQDEFSTRSEAVSRETEIKRKKSRIYIESLTGVLSWL